MPLDPVQGGARTVNQQRAQIAIATFADPQQHLAPTAGAMAWHQSETGRQFAPAPKLGGVTDRGDQGGCGHRTHTFHNSHALAAFMLAEQPVDG